MSLIIKIMGRLQEVVMTVGWHLCNFMCDGDERRTRTRQGKAGDEDEDEMRSVENCRLTHPTAWSAMHWQVYQFFTHLWHDSERLQKEQKETGAKVLHGDDEERLRCNVQPFPKGVFGQCLCACANPNWNQGSSHAKCFQLHCTIFAHIESGNFDNLRNLNVLMNCNILKLRILWAVCNFASFCFCGPDWRIETARERQHDGERCRDKGTLQVVHFFAIRTYREWDLTGKRELKLRLKVQVPQVAVLQD